MANTESSIALRGIRKKLDQLLDQTLRDRVDVYLPVTLSKTFLVAQTPEGVRQSQWVAFAYYLVERVFLATLNKDFKVTKKGGKSRTWVSLPYTAFQGIGGSKYVALRQKLLDAGILECDGSFSYTKHETYGFRLGKQFRSKRGQYRTIKDASVEELLIKHRRAELDQAKQRIRKIAFVAKGWLQPDLIELDKSAALNFLELYDSVMHRRLKKRFTQLRTTAAEQEEHSTQAQNRFDHALHQVEQWGENTQLTVDKKGGRFYNPLGLLLSPLRNFVTYTGQPLVVLDLKNSQPLHLLLLLDHRFWQADSRQTWSLRKLNPDLWEAATIHQEAGGDQRAAGHLIESSISKKQAELEDSTNTHFAELVFAGKLYEFMAETFRGKYFTRQGVDRFGTRDHAKREMLKLMYFDNEQTYSPSQKPYEEFGRLFPGVAKVMDRLKSRSYKDFSVLLQKLEAHFLLHKVCRQVYTKHPTAWFTTIHDAIVATAEHADLVETEILTTYQKTMGQVPSVKRTNLHSTVAYTDLLTYVEDKLDEGFGTTSEKAQPSGYTLAGLRSLLQARAIQQSSLPEASPFGVKYAAMGGDSGYENPFAPPPRKLKR